MNKKRALITGITGFVGSHLAELLLKEKYNVSGTIRWRSKTENIDHIAGKIKLIETDISDPNSVRQAIEKSRPDFIFHLAAQSFVLTSWHAPQQTFTTNVIGTINLLESVRQLKINPVIQIAGSSEEYGRVLKNEIPITEENPLRPLSPYGVSKVAQDLVARQYFMSYGVKSVVTRAFNHTGPRRGDVFATSNFAKQIAEIEKNIKPPVIKHGNLNAIRDFTDVRDVVAGYLLAVIKGEPGEVYNICSGSGHKIYDILQILRYLSPKKDIIKLEEDQDRLRPSDVQILVGNSQKFRKKTGWKPKIELTQTLEDLLDYWRKRV